MVLASHLIITAHGFWLPNDPRGSWSDFVGAFELLRHGRATKITTRRSVAAHRHASITVAVSHRQINRAVRPNLNVPMDTAALRSIAVIG